MSEIKTDMDKLEEARRAESAKTAPIPVATGKVQPKHREPGDAFIIKLVGKEWLSDHAKKAGLKPGMQVKGILTDSPEGDEFHVVGYEFPLVEGSSVLAGQIFAYDSGTEPWKCQVIERLREGEFGDELGKLPRVDESRQADPINHPRHYKSGGMEVIEVIEAFEIDRKSGHLQNVVKYVLRAGEKDPSRLLEDLEKGYWYYGRLLERVRANGGTW